MKIFVTGATGFIGGYFINVVPNEIEVFAPIRSKSKPKIKLNRNVNWIHKDGSKINLIRDSVKMFLGLIRLKINYRV